MKLSRLAAGRRVKNILKKNMFVELGVLTGNNRRDG